MVATLKYGIGQQVTVPVSTDTVARLSEHSVQEALQDLLDKRPDGGDGTALALREAASDPRSVIEVKAPQGYQPVDRTSTFGNVLAGRTDLDVMVSRPHAGG